MHLYGLIIGIAILTGLNYFEKHNQVIPKNRLFIFELGLIVSAILGARIYHVLDLWPYYSQNWQLIPQTWNGGLGIFGAIIGAFIFIFIYFRCSLITVHRLLDSITPILPLCQAIGRLGNFVNHENPSWWLEAIPDLILFFIISKAPKRCSSTALYFIGYGFIRFLTEYSRNDTWVYQNIKIGQIISIVFIIIGLWLFQKPNTPPPSPKH